MTKHHLRLTNNSESILELTRWEARGYRDSDKVANVNFTQNERAEDERNIPGSYYEASCDSKDDILGLTAILMQFEFRIVTDPGVGGKISVDYTYEPIKKYPVVVVVEFVGVGNDVFWYDTEKNKADGHITLNSFIQPCK